jgi:hypothetical protein
LVANRLMTTYYTSALQKLEITKVNTIDAEKAAVDGQCKIFSRNR